MSAFNVIIPARYASTRLPGKPLADIGGLPMVVQVARRAMASGAARVVIATDDARVASAAATHGCEAVMTRAEHPTGTDRVAEAAVAMGLHDDDIVVNVQGDEPLLEPSLMREVATNLVAHADAAIATACHAIDDAGDAFNPNVVKVVRDAAGYALYFSRATIPWARDAFAPANVASKHVHAFVLPPGLPLYRHYGIYAYRMAFLRRYPALAVAPIESFEALEQLRALWHGYRIIVAVTAGAPAPGVDTQQDLERVRRVFADA